MISESTDNILKVAQPSIILNQVNALGYGSIGLMNKIMKLYPSMFHEYHTLCGWFKGYKIQEELIGKFQALPFPDSKNILCNAFSQRFISDTKYQIDVEAWEQILKKVIRQIQSNAKQNGILYEIHCPSKIGVGMKPTEIDELKDVVNDLLSIDEISFVYHI